MPLIKGRSRKAVSENIEKEIEAGKPQKQALAISYSVQRKNKRKKMAEGGALMPIDKKERDKSNTDKALESIRKGFGGKKAKGGMMYAEGGRVELDERQDADSYDDEELRMAEGFEPTPDLDGDSAIDEKRSMPEDLYKDASMARRQGKPRSQESDFVSERRSHASESPSSREMSMAKGERLSHEREKDMRDLGRPSIDDAKTDRDEDMLNGKPTRHADEITANSEKRALADGDNSDDREFSMLKHRYAEGGRVGRYAPHKGDITVNDEERASADYRDEREMDMLYAEGGEVDEPSIASAIRRRKRDMMPEGMADLDRNADEDLNQEDEMSFRAARRQNYAEMEGLEEASSPKDSNLHGRDLPDADSHDMVSEIRKKIKYKRR